MKRRSDFKFEKSLFDHHPAATICIVKDQLTLNRKAQALLGYSDDDFTDLNSWYEVVFGADAEKMKSQHEVNRKLHFQQKERLHIRTKNCGQRIFDFQASFTNDFEIWHLEDVTELLLTEQRYSVLFNHSSDPHLLFDENGISDCNEATVKILGATSKQQILSSHPAVFSPEFQPCGLRSLEKNKLMDAAALEKGFHRFEWVHKKFSGEEFAVDVTLSPVFVAGKKFLLVVWHDLTNIRQAQSVLLSSAKMATLGEMASKIAHEINNPLAIIAGKTEKLKRIIRSDSVPQQLMLAELEKIEKTVHRIAKIINGLRTFARDSKSIQADVVQVDVCLNETIDICREKLKSHEIELIVDLQPELLVYVNSVQLSQVFMNLIGNAFDAISVQSKSWIQVRAFSNKHFAIIEIIDSGHGIPSHIVENMMRPFFTTKELGKGTGLGLSISKGIIESHQGKFYFDAVRDNTCFVIELPLHQGDQLRQSS